MSAAAAIGTAAGANNSDQTVKQNRFGQISSGDFMNILVSQLTHQDPLKPNDSQKILEQLSSVRNIQSQLSLQDQLKSLVTQNQIAQAGGMIGRMVQGKDSHGETISGLVSSVRVVDGKAVLELDSGVPLPMDRVTRIADKAQAGRGVLAGATAAAAGVNAQEQGGAPAA